MNLLLAENEKLIKEFGASPIKELKDYPDFYAFENNSIYSHRDFDKFYTALKKNERCAIVSGLNPSATLHFGHKTLFDLILYFQKKYNILFFIPLSDDESYLASKVKDQGEALKNSFELAKELLAYGFDKKKTFFIIDQIYTNIYNLAIKISKKINLSEIKATYGYKNEENIGLHFYPAIQSAHVLYPQEKYGIKNVLVPIGPDEDAHLRICRDVAPLLKYEKPAILHISFLPGIDGEKMSKSRDNAIFLKDDEKTIRKKVNKAFSGGQKTTEEHRRLGGNPEIDVSCLYLKRFFLNKEEADKLEEDYKKGRILSGEVKKELCKRITEFNQNFQRKIKEIKEEDVRECILINEKNSFK